MRCDEQKRKTEKHRWYALAYDWPEGPSEQLLRSKLQEKKTKYHAKQRERKWLKTSKDSLNCRTPPSKMHLSLEGPSIVSVSRQGCPTALLRRPRSCRPAIVLAD